MENAPDRYIVVKGDTLWSISARFLKDPWRWPDLWHMNAEQVKNPQRIYPGNIIVLDRSKGEPGLKLAREVTEAKLDPKVRTEAIGQEIPSIAPASIEPFLSQPLVIEEGGMDSAPRIIATQEGRVYVGSGNKFYASGVSGSKQNLWQIFRPGKKLVDPDGGATLGYEAFYLGTAQVIREGDPATFEVVTAMQEIGTGDRLVPAARALPMSYVPHSPENFVQGRVLSSYSGVNESGRDSIITINRGARDGMEVGHVLAVYRKGEYFDDVQPNTVAALRDAKSAAGGPDMNDPLVAARARKTTKKVHLKLPDERYGLIFVFRVFERVSYALVLNVSRPVNVDDVVQTP
ncbi:MAG: LysM domain-containing protein [Rhodospirillales bacterium]